MREEDDYTLMDTNFDEFIRRGLEEMEWEKKQRESVNHVDA